MGFGEITATGRCPVCGSSIGRDAKSCKRCAVGYHPDCWTYAGGCAVYGCRPVTSRAAPAFDVRDFPQSCEQAGRQLARLGAGMTRDVLALALGSLLGVAFWDLMDAYGGVFFLMWFLLGLAYLLYWPFFRARGFAVTVMHAFFLGPLVHVVVPLEIPALFALVAGLTLSGIGLVAIWHARSPLLARGALGLALIAVGTLYQSDGRAVRYHVDRSGPDQPTVTAPWPVSPAVLASRASIHAWRVGGQLERLSSVGASMFSRSEVETMLSSPGTGTGSERLVLIPWWGERSPEVTDVVKSGGKLRVIVTLPAIGTPRVSTPAYARPFHRLVVAVPASPAAVEVEYRAAGHWALGQRLALRLAGYDPDGVTPVVSASNVELDAEWMMRRLAPLFELRAWAP